MITLWKGVDREILPRHKRIWRQSDHRDLVPADDHDSLS